MRKFLAILCSVVMVFSSIGVMAATDPYEFEGDINENPWADLFTTTAGEVVETTTEAPEESSSEEPVETTTEEETSAIVDRDDNVALNKTATASSENMAASNAIDGDEGSRWESKHDMDPQWFQVYLEGTYLIDACLINWETAAAKEYTVQVSMDGEEWKTVSTVTSGTSGDTRYLAWDAVQAKYVKIVGTSRTYEPYGYSIWELEVYGSLIEADETTTEEPVEVAPNAPGGLTWAGNDVYPHYFAWAPVDGAALYNIYINDVLVDTSTIQNYNFDASNFAESGEYTIAVTAVSESGLESEKSTYTYTVEVEVETTTEVPEESSSEEPSEVETTTEAPSEEPSEVETTTVSDVFEIVSQPQDIIVAVGDSASLTVNATGQGLTYSWEMSKDSGTTWTTSSADGSKEATIKFNITEAYHGRQYRCVVTDENGEKLTSDVATVFIDALMNQLVIISQPEDKTVSVNTEVKLSVSAIGNGLTYSWEMSRDGGTTWATSTADGSKSTTLTCNVTSAYHGRQYRCVVTDENGNTATSSAATIFIDTLVDELMIVSQPQSKIVTVGTEYKITVGATGHGLTYSWEMSRDGGTTWTTSSVDGSKSSVITFKPTEAYHGRQYRCVVTDENGNTVTSNGATLLIDTLVDELMIVSQPQSKTVTVGVETKITVGATGNGLTYSWEMSKDGGTTWTTSSVDGSKTSVITFKPTDAYHGRQYRCVVTDENGEVVASNGATILIDTLANDLMIFAQPQDKYVSIGTETKISVGATGNGLTYSWELSSDGGLTWATSSVDGSKSPVITFKPTDAYHGRMYRCVVTDENGDTVTSVGAVVCLDEYADELMILTQPNDITVAVGATGAMSIKATGVGLTYSWELSNDGGVTWNTSSVDGSKSPSISFTTTSAYEGRMYRCVVTDANGNSVATRGAKVTLQ